jgi:hypothetical protein
MTDRERLEKLLTCEVYLKRTKLGYAPDRPYWKRAMPLLWEVRLSMRATEDGKLLAEAHGFLKETEKGYDPHAPNWKAAMKRIDWVQAGLAAPPVPQLGQVTPGGKPLSLESLTHETAGLFGSPNSPDPKSHYPALDFGWDTGEVIYAPEPITVTKQSGAQGADAFYATGESTIKYWYGHVITAPANGTRFKRGDVVARIAAISGVDHGHLGVNARALLGGRDLKWGENGRGPDYTYGSPTIGRQLSEAMVV